MILPQLRMERVDLGTVPVIPVPRGYVLRSYRRGDEGGLSEVYAACELGCETRDAVRERIVEREYFRPQRLFIVERAGRIVATATAWEEPGDTPAGYLHMVGVLPSERGKGLGALVTVAAIRRHHEEGFAVQRLHTDDHRHAALRLYLDLGYYPLISHASHASRWVELEKTLNRTAVLSRARWEM